MLARMLLYVGAGILAFGLLMMTRGWIYTLWPNGKIAERRKRRNLKVGFTTDMKLFGRKIRRLGLMLALIGGALVGWKLSAEPTTPDAAPPSSAPAAPAPPPPAAPTPAAPATDAAPSAPTPDAAAPPGTPG